MSRSTRPWKRRNSPATRPNFFAGSIKALTAESAMLLPMLGLRARVLEREDILACLDYARLLVSGEPLRRVG